MYSSPYLCVYGDDRITCYPGADDLTGEPGDAWVQIAELYGDLNIFIIWIFFSNGLYLVILWVVIIVIFEFL